MIRVLALLILVAALALSFTESRAQNAGLPLVQADYQLRCAPVPVGPIESLKVRNPYQRERGIA